MRGNPSRRWDSHNYHRVSSEVDPQGELDNPRVHRGTRDLTKRSRPKGSPRVRKLRVVKHVEKARSEHHIRGVIGPPDVESFAHRHIPVRLVRTPHYASTQIPEAGAGAGGKRTYRRGSDAGLVEIIHHGADS